MSVDRRVAEQRETILRQRREIRTLTQKLLAANADNQEAFARVRAQETNYWRAKLAEELEVARVVVFEEGYNYARQSEEHEIKTRAGKLARDIAARRRMVTPTMRREVLSRDGHRCVRCRSQRHLHIDHVIPWSEGGADHPENLQTLCERCNLAKRACFVDYRGTRKVGVRFVSRSFRSRGDGK